jgi:hypothetical protein
LAKGQLATIHYDSAPRPQRSCYYHKLSKNKERQLLVFCITYCHFVQTQTNLYNF